MVPKVKISSNIDVTQALEISDNMKGGNCHPEEMKMKLDRDVSIDVLRGFAIFTMIAANTAGEILHEPHPFWFRFYGSFAAPLFIFIAGMMVFFTANKKQYDLKYFIKRGAMLIGIASLLDVFIWNLYPFMIFDVLYITGFSLPIAYLVSKLKNNWLKYSIIFAILLGTPVLHFIFGYPQNIKSLGFNDGYCLRDLFLILPYSFKHFTVDGWFPVFPWLGYSLLGASIARERYSSETKFNNNKFLFLGIFAFTLGAILWYLFPGHMYTRVGFSEVFYPPTYGFMITSIGLILLLFNFVDRNPMLSIYKPLKILGGAALFVYITQEIVIEKIITVFFKEVNIQELFVVYSIFILVLIGLCYLRMKIMKASKNNNLHRILLEKLMIKSNK